MTTATTRRSGTRRAAHRMRAGADPRVMRVLAVLLLLLGFSPLMLLTAANAASSQAAEAAADSVDTSVASWPSTVLSADLEKADEYNSRLAARGQTAIGGVYDGNVAGGVDYSGSSDPEYMSTLDGPQGIMATVRIPRIGVTLPVRHGSDDTALANGAGHLYGTSLPVGGRSTHAVITAHRGVPGRMLFTRLDELKPGDPVYVTVMGETLAYRVIETHTVEPDDTGLVRIRPGRDLLTLLTCTPYGVNTQRLLVTAERAEIPLEAPSPEDARGDPMPAMAGMATGAGTFAMGLLFLPPAAGPRDGMHVAPRPAAHRVRRGRQPIHSYSSRKTR